MLDHKRFIIRYWDPPTISLSQIKYNLEVEGGWKDEIVKKIIQRKALYFEQNDTSSNSKNSYDGLKSKNHHLQWDF